MCVCVCEALEIGNSNAIESSIRNSSMFFSGLSTTCRACCVFVCVIVMMVRERKREREGEFRRTP